MKILLNKKALCFDFTIGSVKLVFGLINMHGYSIPTLPRISARVMTATQHPVYCKDRWDNEINRMPIAFNMLQFFKGEARLWSTTFLVGSQFHL